MYQRGRMARPYIKVKPGKTRQKMGGEFYTLDSHHLGAQLRARKVGEKLREKGYKVRVVKEKIGPGTYSWCVWKRRK